MSKRTVSITTAVLLTTLLAACQQTAAPQAKADLVKVNLGATAPMRAQGFTADAPDMHYDVTVRTAGGAVVRFDGTTYTATGGTTTITLSHDNDYEQTLLLPKGDYTFETKAKDDATSSVLLGYGPGSENAATVDAGGNAIRVKTHAVIDATSSALKPMMALNTLYTDSNFNLGLYPKTAPVGASSATVPTADIGPVTYTLGSSTDGVLGGTGSKLGVNVTARGTSADSTLNVAATFNAWVYQPGNDTAAFMPVTLNYAQAIQTNALLVDHTMPTVTFTAVASANQNQITMLSGTVGDDTQVQALRVYDGVNLIASSDPDDQVAVITLDGQGGWSAPWTAADLGDHALTVIAEDSSGNESRQEQTVTVVELSEIVLNVNYDGLNYNYTAQAGEIRVFKINTDTIFGGSMLHLFNNASGDAQMTIKSPSGMITDGFGGFIHELGTYTLTVVTPSAQTVNLGMHLD